MNEFEQMIYDRFQVNNKNLRVFSRLLKQNSRLSNMTFKSKDLLNAATRLTTPKPFMDYVNSIEAILKKPFPDDLIFSKSEVLESDLESIKTFSKEEFSQPLDYFNHTIFIRSSIQAAEDIGMLRRSSKYKKISALESLDSFQTGTSSGFPTFRKKGTDYARTDALDWVKVFLAKPHVNNIMCQPTAVFHRYQYKIGSDLKSINKKIRQVWGVPFRVLTLSGIYFRSIVTGCTDYCLSTTYPAASWGRTKSQISKDIISELRTYKKDIVSLDISKFDANVRYYFWSIFYAIVIECLDLEDGDIDIIDKLMLYDCFTPYVHGNNKLKFQMKGVPSGSLITSLFDTFVNRLITNYACYEYSKHFAGSTACSLGDDLVFTEFYCSFRHMINTFNRFGLPVSVDKTSVSRHNKPIRFLGYVWDTENRPTESEEWFVSHLTMPSRFFRGLDISEQELQTYRGITISMGLYKGMDTFERLVGWNDPIWKRLVKEYRSGTKDPLIVLIEEDQRTLGLRVPISTIITEGWEAF